MPRNANQNKQASYSLHFTPGSTTSVNLGDALSFFIGSFSASMWVKSPNNGVEFFSRYIGANGVGNFRIGCGANSGATANTVSLITKNILLSGSTDIRDGNWHHVCVTMDAISSTQYTRTIYVDGSQDAQDTVGLATYVSTSSSYGLNLGCNFPNNGHNNVDMSEVSIFDYALSASQVTTLYGNSTNGVGNPMALPSPPIAYYPLGTSAWNGQYLAENNAIGDYVFDFVNTNSNYIQIPSSTDFAFGTGDFTISAWVDLDSSSSYSWILGSDSAGIVDGVTFGFDSSRNLQLWVAGAQTATSFSINLNQWHHVLATRNSGTVTFYIDGSAFGTTYSRTGNVPVSSYNIGRLSNGNNYIDGSISNVQIFNTSLSGPEVKTLYNYGSPIRTLANIPQSSNLKAWYKLDASEIYNSSSTEWEINDSTATELKAFAFDLKQSGGSVNNELVATYPNNELNGLSSITTAFWLYANDSIAAYDGIYINRTGTHYFLINVLSVASDSYSIYAQGKNGTNWTVTSNAGIKKNTWNHIALVCESSSIKLYVNGIDETLSSSNNFPGITQTNSFNIGSDGTSRNFDGLMSNFQVWNTDLSDPQVLSLYNNGKPIQTLNNIPQNSNLIGWWQLNDTATFDGTNWSVPDDSGNNNTGVSLNMTQANLVNSNVSTLNGESSGMTQANLVQSDLQTVAPYSKYALDFDASSSDYIDFNSINLGTTNTISFWHKRGNTTSNQHVLGTLDGTNKYLIYFTSSRIYIRPDGTTQFLSPSLGNTPYPFPPYKNTTDWANYIITRSGDNIKLYLNGVEFALSGSGSGMAATTVNRIGTKGNSVTNTINGLISNVSFWNATLTQAQVTEIYNEGLPSNLNSHSAYSNLVSWWQLGENSSFNGNDWIVADEKGNNNGTSVGMPVGALVNGVGTTANGLSSGMSEGNLVGDAPYSTANALSTNMVVTSRVTGSGNTP